MKKTCLFLLLLMFITHLSAQINDTLSVEKRNTRSNTIEEAFPFDTITNSSLLIALDGVSVDKVKEAYRHNRMAVDSILAADSLNPNIWRVYGYQAAQVFVQANKSPSVAMAIFLPVFLIMLSIVMLVLLIKTFLIHPRLITPVKPENDQRLSTDTQQLADMSGQEGEETSPDNQ